MRVAAQRDAGHLALAAVRANRGDISTVETPAIRSELGVLPLPIEPRRLNDRAHGDPPLPVLLEGREAVAVRARKAGRKSDDVRRLGLRLVRSGLVGASGIESRRGIGGRLGRPAADRGRSHLRDVAVPVWVGSGRGLTEEILSVRGQLLAQPGDGLVVDGASPGDLAISPGRPLLIL